MGQPVQETLRLEASIREALAESGQPGHALRVTVIRGGKSKNGYLYDQSALQSIAQMLEGAHAYADHARSSVDESTRSVRDIVGFYHDAEVIPARSDEPAGRVDATLHIFETADWLWSLIQEACALGRPELVGLSIDILGKWQQNQESQAREVTRVLSLNSCDIVTRPSAGGSFRRILHHQTGSEHASPASPPADHTTINHPVVPQGEISPMSEQHSEEATSTTSEHASHIVEQQSQLEHLRLQVEQQLQEVRQQKAELTLERRLQESALPIAVKEQIKARLTNRIFEEAELEQELSQAINMMAQLTRDGLIHGQGYEKTAITDMISEAEKIQAAFDRMFDLEIDSTRLGNIRGFGGLREAYMRVTGDSSLMAGISGSSTLGQVRVSESSPVARITEADITTANFSYLLGSSMNKRLLKDYQSWPAEWMKFVSIAPIRDFKQQTRVRFGHFGSLPVVPEDTTYTTATLIDSAATYVPQKRGNLVTVSREVIINDDLMAVKQIPTKLAVAAAYTLAEFVYGFLSANANIYDGSALFTTGAPHSNLGNAALSTAAMQTGVTAMREQTNYAGKRIGLRPRFLIVPPELEWVAMVATKSAGIPGSSANDLNPMLGYVTPIVSPQLSNTTQWFMAADPRECDTLEVGFVGGIMNPSLFIQDSPMYGLNFTQDILSFKCRQEYGGCVTDYRGLYRGV
jgi:hypothetical protein